jgi:hypothetical protein
MNLLRRFTLLAFAVGLVGLAAARSASADTIDFEDQTGPSFFSEATAQTLTYTGTSSGTLTITGGTVLTDTSSLPADETSVYGTAYFGNALSNTITLTFSSDINNFFFDLINGQVYADTFTVSDNLGNTATYTIPSNADSGVALVSLPAEGNVVTITTTDPGWDFFIDNIGFNQSTPGTVPEPAALSLLCTGLGGIMLMAMFRRRSEEV